MDALKALRVSESQLTEGDYEWFDMKSMTSTESTDIMVLLSGGLDSACCVDFYLDLGRRVEAMHISYGQAAEVQELCAAERLSEYYSVKLHRAYWHGLKQKAVGSIVGRNAFFVLAALMEKPDSVRTIAIGIHAGTAYADCGQEFVGCLSTLLSVYAPPRVSIGTPFIDWSKGDLFEYARSRNIPIDQTYSCERGGAMPCGSCDSCLDRRELTTHAR